MTDKSEIHLTPSQENYLELIYRIGDNQPVKVRDLASGLGIKLPSVSRAVKKLAQLGLVDHKSYGNIRLTETGEKLAAQITRRHECLTRLLTEVLNMPRDKAIAEVHRLEHVISDDLLGRLEKLIDFAVSSEGWLKRLHIRVKSNSINDSEHLNIKVGSSQVHIGLDKDGNPDYIE